MKTIYISYEVLPQGLEIFMHGRSEEGVVVRDEGKRPMQLQSRRYLASSASIDFSRVHLDIIAMCAVLVFHPVLPSEAFELRFFFPVSEQLERALRVPMILPQAQVRAQGRAEPFQARCEAVLSYGGGFDSLAAHVLLPELPLVHQTPIALDGQGYEDVVSRLLPEISPRHVLVADNMRSMYTVWGLPLWVSVYVAALLCEPRRIISGSELTGTYLEGGKRYRPRHNNRWYEAFRRLGVDVLPTSFLSEIANARIVRRAGRTEQAAYCALIRNQDCGRCTKCLRRRTLRAMADPSEIGLLDRFQRSASSDAFVRTRPLYYGDVYTHALAGIDRQTWLHGELQDLLQRHPDLSFLEHFHPQAFDDFAFPPALRSQLREGLRRLDIAPMDASRLQRLQAYVQ